MTLDEGGLERAGWCFQTEEDLLLTTEAYVNSHCPETRKALTEVKEILECVHNSPDSDEKEDTDAVAGSGAGPGEPGSSTPTTTL